VTTSVKKIAMEWQGDLRFEGGELGRPWIPIDGDNAEAPGPMLLLLLAAASCSGSDVLIILKKMRVAIRSLRVEVEGTRRAEEPRRYTAITLAYHIAGDGLDPSKAERAIALSLEKYCSVVHSLAPDITVASRLVLD
jgi:putative redox protein